MIRYPVVLFLVLSSSWAGAATDLLSLYRWFHQNPELSFQEEHTAARMAAEFESLGMTVTSGVGGHGVVATLANGDGPTVMLRADMDALPVREQTGLEYASTATAIEQTGQQVQVMHACGHDVHMTVLIGTLRELIKNSSEWQGTLVAIAQPAEERGAGARAMLEDGLFERFPRPDFNLALHTSAGLPAGTVGYRAGYAMANVDSVDIVVHGIGTHGSAPQHGRDPIVIGAHIVTALQTLVSREISPLDPGVVTVGAFQSGAKHNIISDRAHLQLTVRSYSEGVRQTLLEGIERIAHNQARALGVDEDSLPTVTVKQESTPSLWNDPDLVERLLPVFRSAVGADQVVEVAPVMGGEDFARYGRDEPRIPSLLFRLGSVHHERIAAALAGELHLPSLHSPLYYPDPAPTLDTGVKTMTAAALELFTPRRSR